MNGSRNEWIPYKGRMEGWSTSISIFPPTYQNDCSKIAQYRQILWGVGNSWLVGSLNPSQKLFPTCTVSTKFVTILYMSMTVMFYLQWFYIQYMYIFTHTHIYILRILYMEYTWNTFIWYDFYLWIGLQYISDSFQTHGTVHDLRSFAIFNIHGLRFCVLFWQIKPNSLAII